MNWPGKLIFTLTSLLVLFALIGIARNQNVKINQMPAAIQYQIIVFDNIWPDQFYAASYSLVDPSGFEISDYWTFEPTKQPFSPSRWIYHAADLKLTNVNSAINEIER